MCERVTWAIVTACLYSGGVINLVVTEALSTITTTTTITTILKHRQYSLARIGRIQTDLFHGVQGLLYNQLGEEPVHSRYTYTST